MKKITKILLLFTTLFFTTSFVNTAHSQCDSATLHTFNGIDSYGDGWNGGSVDILVNGTSVLSSAFTVTEASGSTTFLAQTGDQITLVWDNGSWPGEISFSISNPNGETIGSGGVSATGPFTASGCPVPAGSCAAPNSLSTTSTTTDSATATWVDNTVDGSDSFDLEYTDPNGTATTVNDVSSPYTITGLSSNTTYTFNVTSNCATGSETSSDSSFTTSTETLIVSSDCIDFESGSSLYVALTDNTQSSASYDAAAASSSSYGIILQGGSSGTNWTGGSNSTTEDNAWIDNVLHQSSIDIEVDATSETGVILTFDLKQTYTYGATYSNFRVTVDGTQIGDNLRPTTQSSDEFVNQSYDLSAYAGTSFSLKLEFSGKYNAAYTAPGDNAFIDNICITPPPTCPAPTDLSATATSATEATVSWTAGGSETTWEYVVQSAGTGEPTETGSFTTTNPLSLSELTPDTAYEIYLRADCGGSPPAPGEFTGSGDTSTWVSTTFTTPPSCPAPTGLSASATSSTEATVSWTAGGSEAAWEYVYQAAGTGEPTVAGTATTTNPLSLTGLSSNTDYEIYLRSDCGDEFSSWALATFTTPLGCGDSVSYDYSSFESGPLYTVSAPAGQYISVTLSGSTEDGYDFVSIEDGSGASLASQLSGSLSGTYESTDGTIVVILESDSSVQQGPAGFAFSCYDPPACEAPTNLSVSTTATEASVSWNAGGSEAAWEYVYQAAGTGEPTGSGTATTTNPLTLSGLTASTDYEIYLRADCDGDFSSWALTTFSTPCETFTGAWSHDFDVDNGIPDYYYCWAIVNGGDANSWVLSTGGNFVIEYSPSGDPHDDYLISPTFSVESGISDRFNFDARNYDSSYAESVDVQVWNSDYSVMLGTLATNVTPGTSYESFDYDLSAYDGQDIRVAFHITTEYLYYIYIDNVSVDSPDIQAPVITLVGDDPLELTVGDTYTDPGATATDNVDGDLTDDIVVGGDTVSTSASGTFTVTYDVSDAAGNQATQVTRAVNVSCPAPTNLSVSNLTETSATLNWTSTGTAFMVEIQPSGVPQGTDTSVSGGYVVGDYLPVTTSYFDIPAGFLPPNTAIDFWIINLCEYTGDGSAPIVITDSAISASGTFTTLADTEAPVMSLIGDDPLELNIGDTYTEQGVTITDNVDSGQTLQAALQIGGDTVNTSVAGSYTITYDVSDAAGNQATQVTRAVNVSCPAPTNLSVSNLTETSATLNWTSTGTAFMVEIQPSGVPQGTDTSVSGGYVVGDYLPVTTSYFDIPAGFLPPNTAIDFWIINLCEYTGDGSAPIVITDSAISASGTFTTLADTEAPVMSLIGDDPLELNIGDTYTEQGVTITDNVDSGQTLQAALQIGGDTVNTSVAGSYTITYDVSDAAGNQATQVTRVVIVNSPALELRGVLDLSLGGNHGKAVHVVVNADIPDLSIYAIGVSNSAGQTGADYTFPSISVLSGDHILAHRETASVIQAYLEICYDGFDYVFASANLQQNGDDAVELFENGVVIETFGDINVDGSGEDWDYLDSWAYKVDGVWTYGAVNCTDNSTTTSSSNCPYPFCGSDWTGDVSTAWHSDGNWSDGSVPDYTKDVTIATGLTNYPTVSTDASANSVSVATSATLTISENGSLTTTGDFTNAGTVTMNSDSQEFSSLIVGGTSSGDINYNRFVNQYSVPGDDNIQWDLIGSPVDGLEISSFANDNPSLATSGDYFAVGTYDNSTQLWTNYTSANATGVNFDMGLGYQMGTLSGSTLSFEGSVTTANQTQTISDNSGSGGDYWNLVSNPYPSYLNLNESSDATDNFVSENSVSIYGWNAGSTGAYTVYNQISPTPNAAQYLAPGQGFFVSAEIASQVTFTNAMQTVSGSDDFVSGRMDNAFTYFYLKLNEGDNTVANSMFYFGDGMAYGYDAGYDAEAFSQSTKIMSRALEGNVELGMQVNAMPKEALDDSTVIPLEVNQTAGTAFSIGLTDVVNLAENVEVYLEDTELQTLTDLKVEDYTLNPSYDLSGAGRFYLVFGANSLGGTTIDESYISIYKAANDDFVTIEGLLNVEKANVQLFNIIGQEVLNTTLKTNQSTQRISTTELAAGVYVIKLKADNAVISKKLIIN